MAGVLTHFCNVRYGEGVGNMARDESLVDPSSATTLYSGRIYYKNSSGMATEGLSGPGVQLFIAHRGVDHPDVGGLSAITNNMTGAVLAVSGYGRISGIPLRPGLNIETSEYHSGLTWTNLGAPVACATGSGELRIASGPMNAGEVLGYVDAAPRSVHDLDVVGVQVVRAGWGL